MPNDLRYRASLKDDVSTPLERIRDKFEMVKKQGATGFGLGIGASVGTKALNAIGDATDLVVRGVVGAINAASDLNETMTKSEVIFGDSADEISDWGDTASDAFGQSKRQAIDTASGFAGLFKTVGIGLDQSATYAKQLTQLGSDLASFFNTDVQTAIDSLKSGLSGESEPLRKFNVFLSETAVAAKLAEMGIKKVGTQFTEAQKATARYALIMEQTTDAQGDFARTSDGLANSQRTLEAQIEDLGAKFGQLATGPLAEATQAFSGFLDDVDEASQPGGPLDIAGKLIGDLGNSFDTDPMYEATTALGEFDQAATDALSNFVDLISFWDGKTTDATDATVANFKRIREAVAEDTAPEFVSSSREMGRAVGRLEGKASDASGAFRDLGKKVANLVGDFKDLKKWAAEAGDTLAEASYGPEELALKFGEVTRELDENQTELEKTRKKIHKLRDDGKPVPKELKEKFHDLRLEVNEGKQEVIRLGTKLRVTGGISMSALRSEFARLGIRIDTSTAKAADLWWYLNHIANVDLGTSYDNQKQGIGGRAAGGPVLPGQTYLVGENGPELLRMGSGSGIVSPGTGGAMLGGGGGVTINVHTPVLTPGAAEALARELGPIVTKWQQDRRLLARP